MSTEYMYTTSPIQTQHRYNFTCPLYKYNSTDTNTINLDNYTNYLNTNQPNEAGKPKKKAKKLALKLQKNTVKSPKSGCSNINARTRSIY